MSGLIVLIRKIGSVLWAEVHRAQSCAEIRIFCWWFMFCLYIHIYIYMYIYIYIYIWVVGFVIHFSIQDTA